MRIFSRAKFCKSLNYIDRMRLKDNEITRWGQFTGINEEMLKLLDVAFEKWLNP